MEFRNLYYFLQLCEEKNYSSAAGKLYITQQALSKSIKALEKELGSALFTKTPQGIRLTAYGEAVYPICKDMIQHFEVGVQKIRSISADGVAPIRLAVAYQTADTLSFTLLDDFQRAHPGVRILSEALPDPPRRRCSGAVMISFSRWAYPGSGSSLPMSGFSPCPCASWRDRSTRSTESRH